MTMRGLEFPTAPDSRIEEQHPQQWLGVVQRDGGELSDEAWNSDPQPPTFWERQR